VRRERSASVGGGQRPQMMNRHRGRPGSRCRSGCSRWPTRPAGYGRGPEPVPPAGRGRPAVGGAHPARCGPDGPRPAAHPAGGRPAQPRRAAGVPGGQPRP
jgi:hypothetical protein